MQLLVQMITPKKETNSTKIAKYVVHEQYYYLEKLLYELLNEFAIKKIQSDDGYSKKNCLFSQKELEVCKADLIMRIRIGGHGKGVIIVESNNSPSYGNANHAARGQVNRLISHVSPVSLGVLFSTEYLTYTEFPGVLRTDYPD